MRRLAMKKKCLQHRALIVAWLRVNYCLQESGSIAKRDVFVHYLELCRANKIKASSAASFGKILKLAFPTVRCNRVGPRGASKHHYRGLALKDDYSTSLEGVVPLNEEDIVELMKHMSDNGDDDDDDDSGDSNITIKTEYSSPHERPSSPAGGQGPRSQFNSPPTDSVPPQTLFPPYHSHTMPMYPHPHLAGKPYSMLPLPQPFMAAHPGMDKKESFSWISPDMDAGKRMASYPVLPPPMPQQGAVFPPSFLPDSTGSFASAAQKEWQEKRELVEFCDRNFQSLYDAIMRTNCGEAKEEILAYVGDAWKNLRQYTKHFNVFGEPNGPLVPPPPPSSAVNQAARSSPPSKGTYQPGQTEYRSENGERYGGTYPRESPSNTEYQHAHRPHQQHTPHKRNSLSSSPHPAAEPASQQPPPVNQQLPHALLYSATQPLSFSGSSSSLSLSWLNSMAYSMGAAARTATLPSPTPLSATSAAFPSSYALTDIGNNRGSLEGLEYRSFEWKGVFE